MDMQGRDRVVEVINQAGINPDLYMVMPERQDIPEEGVRFVGILLLDKTLKHDIARSLMNSGLMAKSGNTEAEPSFRHLYAKPDSRLGIISYGDDLDDILDCEEFDVDCDSEDDILFLEDVKLVGSGVEEDEAQRIYNFQHIAVLDIPQKPYNALTKLSLNTLHVLCYATRDGLLDADNSLTEDDIDTIDNALSAFNLSIGCKNEDSKS